VALLTHKTFYKNQVEVSMWSNNVKSGITGWAQVIGLRGETDTREKLKSE
jgi:putative colanic acid biosynthesis UDP-glucose lipid carrier transferase